MSVTTTDARLDQILNASQSILAEVSTNRLLAMLELLRDHVKTLSDEHEAIRNDLRELYNVIMSTQGGAAG